MSYKSDYKKPNDVNGAKNIKKKKRKERNALIMSLSLIKI